MIRPDNALPSVFLYREAVDMRKGANGLSIIVQEQMQRCAGSGEVFVFCSRHRDKIKLLTWERNGFVVWYKRLDKQRFHWPSFMEEDPIVLTGEQLNWLLDGINLNRFEKHSSIDFLVVA
jgi:transposase